VRFPMLAFFLIIAALLGNTEAGNAQSPYYPWCGSYAGLAHVPINASCYYTSREQCMATLGFNGGICVESPYYHPQPPPQQLRAQAPHSTENPRHRRHRH
jgi:hypothetical protein